MTFSMSVVSLGKTRPDDKTCGQVSTKNNKNIWKYYFVFSFSYINFEDGFIARTNVVQRLNDTSLM